MAPQYVSGAGVGDHGHMVLGDGHSGYLLTLMIRGPRKDLMIVEVWADNMIGAIARVGEVSDGEVVCCLKLWV